MRDKITGLILPALLVIVLLIEVAAILFSGALIIWHAIHYSVWYLLFGIPWTPFFLAICCIIALFIKE